MRIISELLKLRAEWLSIEASDATRVYTLVVIVKHACNANNWFKNPLAHSDVQTLLGPRKAGSNDAPDALCLCLSDLLHGLGVIMGKIRERTFPEPAHERRDGFIAFGPRCISLPSPAGRELNRTRADGNLPDTDRLVFGYIWG